MGLKQKQKNKNPESYRIRSYRRQAKADGLLEVHVKVKETDLHIQADRDVKRRAEELVLECRLQLEEYIIRYPEFLTALDPIPKDFTAPPIIKHMFDAGRKAGVGPMAAVAGGVAEYVGTKLLDEGVGEIIIENGGDIFLSRKKITLISIFAGTSPLSSKVGLELTPPMPWGVCTSSGTVGHSLSMGEADSVTVIAKSTYLADAAATRLGNEVGKGDNQKANVQKALEIATNIEEIIGTVVICGEAMGAVGDVKLVNVG